VIPKPTALVVHSPPPCPALLTIRMIVEHFIPAGDRTIRRWISSGVFPKADIAIGGKTRFWKVETVESWIESQAASR
jgi:predicted DNA-binding transcriptional regulator AlpA